MCYFAYKTKFLQCKFWIGYSALPFCTVEQNDGNNEAEHKNIMTFGGDLFFAAWPTCAVYRPTLGRHYACEMSPD